MGGRGGEPGEPGSYMSPVPGPVPPPLGRVFWPTPPGEVLHPRGPQDLQPQGGRRACSQSARGCPQEAASTDFVDFYRSKRSPRRAYHRGAGEDACCSAAVLMLLGDLALPSPNLDPWIKVGSPTLIHGSRLAKPTLIHGSRSLIHGSRLDQGWQTMDQGWQTMDQGGQTNHDPWIKVGKPTLIHGSRLGTHP